MSISERINILKKFKNLTYPILTIYLSFLGSKTPSTSELKRQFHSLMTQNLTAREKKHFGNTIQSIDDYFDETYDSRGKRSVAFFGNGQRPGLRPEGSGPAGGASGPEGGLFEILEFEFPIAPLCRISNSVFLDSITSALLEHKRYLVILIDREKTRLFTVHLGEIKEHEDVFINTVPQKVRADEEHFYGRSDKIFRHTEDHLNRHLRLVAEKAREFMKGKRINFIILGGHEELFEKMKRHLRKDIRDKIAGEFVTELNVPINSVYLASKKIAKHIEQDKVYAEMESSLAGV